MKSPSKMSTRFLVAMILTLLSLVHDGFALTRKKIDFVVGVDGDFKAAMAAAAKSASSSNRFVMFFPDGEYNIGSLTGNSNQLTEFKTANVSFVGQSEDKTVLYNKSSAEGISVTATLYFNGADNLYMQDMSILNKANYGDPSTYGVTGRHVAIQEKANKMIYRDVRLLSTQDTYYTKGTRTYWEGGQIHGTTDFICGNGDVFFYKVLLWEMKVSAMTAPATTTPWGYVFKECTIDGTVSGFNLGRSWGTARAAFLNTTMNKLPSAGGWGADMNSAPQLFAEYKSVTASGSAVDMSKRVKSTILTDAAAAKFTVANVLGGSDSWKPDVLAKQLAAPTVSLGGSKLTWADDAGALFWVVFRNGKYLANVTTNTYDATSTAKGDLLTVRAANSMGGLGPSSKAVTVGTPTGISALPGHGSNGLAQRNRRLIVEGFDGAPVELAIRDISGEVLHRRRLSEASEQRVVDLSSLGLDRGVYLATVTSPGYAMRTIRIQLLD